MVGFFGLYYVLFLLVTRATGVDLPFGQLFAAYAIGRLLTAVGVTPGGLGVTETGTAAALVAWGADPAAAMAGVVLFSVFTHLMEVPLGAIGWLASGALVLEKLATLQDPNHTTVCDVNPWISCGEVMKTWQSSLFGFPNMFIGIVAFAVIITVGMALLSGATFAKWFWAGLQAGVTLGFAFVVWLWSQALYDIHVLCPFCMIVWAAMIPLFVWTTIRNITACIIPVPSGAARIAGDSGWIIVALLYVGVIASIFFAFIQVFVGTSGF